MQISLERARRVRIAAQGLGRAHRTIEAALDESALVRTLGGVEAYVALFARVAGLSAGDLHAAIDRRDVQVVPAVRGCMYLVARGQAPLCLRVAERMSSARDQREHDRAGIRPGELDDLGRAIVETLRADPAGLTTDALRRALPPGAARSLGDIGKKIGLSSTLPPALRRLELRGQVVRAVDGGRLDSERYRWTAVPDPATYHGSDDWIDLLARIAALYFRAAGIGNLAELAAWSGASRRDAAAAAETLSLVPVEVEGEPGGGWMLEERRHLLDEAADDRDPLESDPVALLPFEDNLLALQGGPAAFVDVGHHDLSLAIEEPDRPTRLRDARHAWAHARRRRQGRRPLGVPPRPGRRRDGPLRRGRPDRRGEARPRGPRPGQLPRRPDRPRPELLPRHRRRAPPPRRRDRDGEPRRGVVPGREALGGEHKAGRVEEGRHPGGEGRVTAESEGGQESGRAVQGEGCLAVEREGGRAVQGEGCLAVEREGGRAVEGQGGRAVEGQGGRILQGKVGRAVQGEGVASSKEKAAPSSHASKPSPWRLLPLAPEVGDTRPACASRSCHPRAVRPRLNDVWWPRGRGG